MDLKDIKLNLNKEVDGIWVEIDSDTSLCIARMHNPAFNRLFEKLSTPHRQTARKGLMDDEKALELMNIAIAKTILLNWKGLKKDGQIIEYSTDKAIEILNDLQLSSFRELVIDIASNEANYRDEEIAETGKKLNNTSSGQKLGATN